MAEDAEAGRELERLRAELTEFVVDAMARRAASGDQPELGAALVEAIDRRVDRSVDARMADLSWPDPAAFADEVIAAARHADGAALPRSGSRPPRGKSGSVLRPGGAKSFALGFITALGIALAAYLIYSALQRPAPVRTNVQQAPIVNGIEPTSAGPVNVLIENAQAPVPTANQQSPVR